MKHIESNLPAHAHTPMYNWHKYWARKTWNVVGAFVENYCSVDGIVLDPFSGSGVTAIESLRRGRRVIAIDLSPMANNILRATVTPTDLLDLRNAYGEVKKQVREKILKLYLTKCRNCHKQIEFECLIWNDGKPKEVHYKCSECGDRQEKGCSLLPFDMELLNEITKTDIIISYPKQPLYYPNGQPFMKKEKYESIDELFTHRNLLALALLRNAIENISNIELRFMLKMAFTSMVHLCSRLAAMGRPGYRPFSGVGWNQQRPCQ